MLRPGYPAAGPPPPQLGMRDRFRLVASDRRLATLALASMPFSALQIALNTCFVSFGTFELGLTHVEAGAALACAQAGGLVGRIGWGLVAVRLSARRVLVLTGVGMAMAAVVFGSWGAMLGDPSAIQARRAFPIDRERLEWRIPRGDRTSGTGRSRRRDDRCGSHRILHRPAARADPDRGPDDVDWAAPSSRWACCRRSLLSLFEGL